MSLALLAVLSFRLMTMQQLWVGCKRLTIALGSVLVMTLVAIVILALTIRTSSTSNASVVASMSAPQSCFAISQTRLIRLCLRKSSTKLAMLNTISCICVLISQITAMSAMRSSISRILPKLVRAIRGIVSTAIKLRKYPTLPSKERTAWSKNSATAL
ncbi:hypothetical protein EMPG_16389 [Blastomyces silverae]|uniref:Uncharacterized protein n=1 Tax=Blastomyces silverae TaxID=2060906 RepID=A0A0H1B9M7_9EURO|nr:hypothetical protein EMPG_16389 [Blastomyces silverae]